MNLVHQQVQICQRINRVLDRGLPELREAFEDPTCDTALAVLRKTSQFQ